LIYISLLAHAASWLLSYAHTLLRRALADAQSCIATVRGIRTSIELLVAAPLQRSADVHEGVTLDLKFAVDDTGIGDGGSSDTTKCAGEGLEVGSSLTTSRGRESGRAESGCDERGDDKGRLHVDGIGDKNNIASKFVIGYRVGIVSAES
jgi:hypothetical protein